MREISHSVIRTTKNVPNESIFEPQTPIKVFTITTVKPGEKDPPISFITNTIICEALKLSIQK